MKTDRAIAENKPYLFEVRRPNKVEAQFLRLGRTTISLNRANCSSTQLLTLKTLLQHTNSQTHV